MEKKISFQGFNGVESLTRNQLKNVLGGNTELAAACPEGQFSCSCTGENGKTVSSCQSTIEGCWSSC